MRLRYRYVSYSAGPGMIEQMQHLHQLMHQMMARPWLGGLPLPTGTESLTRAPGATGAWQPPADVYETDAALVVQVELAGVREEEIDITLFSDYLSITGTRRHHTPAGPIVYHLAGILYGHFRLELPLMAEVARDEVEATFENGLLTITLPKVTARNEQTAVSIQPPASPERDADGSAPEGVHNGA